MTATVAIETPTTIASEWLRHFGEAFEQRDTERAADLFIAEGWWRDLLAFTWDLRTFHGTEKIGAAFKRTLAAAEPRDFRLEPGREAVLAGTDAARTVEAFYRFETKLARGRGFIRLMPSEHGSWKAWTLLTAIEELKGHEEHVGARRVKGVAHGEQKWRRNWLDQRVHERAFDDADPQVLVVGGGQAGLTIAARL